MVNDEVEIKYYNGFYDGPISGVAEWQGRRYYFHMIDEAEPADDHEEPPWYRQYALYDLTEHEWAEEDARHASFERYVGTHTTYLNDGTRNHAGIKPQELWARHYERYPQPRSWETTPMGVSRPAVHMFYR